MEEGEGEGEREGKNPRERGRENSEQVCVCAVMSGCYELRTCACLVLANNILRM